MRNILTVFLASLLFASITINARAQAVDMALIDPSVLPKPASYPGTATIGFKVLAEILDQPLSSDDLGISYATITVTLNNLQGSSAILPTGSGADLFNWQYIAAQNTYIGTSKDVTMFADVQYQITFDDLPIIQATSATTYTTGFLANLTPPGDVYSSESIDDAVSIYTGAPLPVTLVSFKVEKEGNLVQLAWSTTEETNSDRFEIERSANGKNWNKIGSVVSNGESSVLRNYNYTDQTPLNGENLYRLKMIDNDATFAYSSIRSVRFEGLANSVVSAYVYPNPSTERVFLKTADLSSVSQVFVLDLNGRIVLTTKVVAEGISVRSLSTGAYILKVFNADGSTSVHKFLISR